MKVAHVTLYPPRGEKHISTSGVASYGKNLITNIPLKHQSVVCGRLESGGETHYDDDDIHVHRAFDRRPSFVIDAHRELKTINADIVHIQQELALFGGIVSAYLLQWLVWLWRNRVVITLHGVVDPRKIDRAFVRENNSRLPVFLVKLAFRIIYTPLMKWSRRIIVHEEHFKNIIVNSYHIDAAKITVIPHGVEMLSTIDQQDARRQLDLPVGGDLVLFMGYATGYKGIDLLIEGFAQYAKINPNAFLVIGAGKHPKLGDDPTYLADYDRLQQKAKALIPGGQFTWRGFIAETDITAYYSASDVSVYPYTTALSSSGPMSFAIGYEKPFLVSSAFADIFGAWPHLLFDRSVESLVKRLDYYFKNQHEYSHTSTKMKRDRNWKKVGLSTLGVYETVEEEGGL